jgi:hypothetical protein
LNETESITGVDETNGDNKQKDKASSTQQKEKLLSSSEILKDYRFDENDRSLKIEIAVLFSFLFFSHFESDYNFFSVLTNMFLYVMSSHIAFALDSSK